MVITNIQILFYPGGGAVAKHELLFNIISSNNINNIATKQEMHEAKDPSKDIESSGKYISYC